MRVLIFLCLIISISAKISYDGHEVWKIQIQNEKDFKVVKQTILKNDLDVWAADRHRVDVRISPDIKGGLAKIYAEESIQYDVIIASVQELIDSQERKRSGLERVFSNDKYNTLEEIEEYLQDVASRKSNAELYVLGQSIEGRNITQIRFSNGLGNPKVWIDCGIHAREWIAPATCMYGVSQFDNDAEMFLQLLDSYDVYIAPVTNPDGYEYTWTDERTWRKNRRDHNDSECYGVDLNRNFDNNFGGVGTSPVLCADTYPGEYGFSEPETQAIRDAILGDTFTCVYSIHAYSQLWMYPYGYTTELPADNDLLAANANISVAALESVHGTNYEYGTIANIIYEASGGEIDWTYDNASITYSFGLELRDEGEYGFLLPEDQIIPTGEETWAGLIAGISAM